MFNIVLVKLFLPLMMGSGHQFNSSTAPLAAVGREALSGHWIFVLNTSCRTATLCVVAI